MPLGGGHIVWIILALIVVLIIFGPGKLPEIGAGAGRAIREFRKATSEARDHVMNAGSGDSASAPSSSAPPAAPANPAPPADPVASSPTPAGGDQHPSG